MNKEIITFCPDVGGVCIGDGCSAYGKIMQVNIVTSINYLNQIICTVDTKENNDIITLKLGIECKICKKYDKFLTQESHDIFKDVLEDFSE